MTDQDALPAASKKALQPAAPKTSLAERKNRDVQDPIALGALGDRREQAIWQVNQRSGRLVRNALLVVLVFFGGFFAWSALAPLESAVPAVGQVVVESNRKNVQPEKGGVIQEILHRDGDLVKQGDVLVRFDDTRARSTYQILLGRFRELKALQARLVAERDDADRISFPAVIEKDDSPSMTEIVEGQRKIFETRRTSLNNERDILEKKITGLQEEINGLRALIASRAEQLRLVTEEAGYMSILLEKGLAMKSRVLALQRGKAELEGKQGEDIAAIARAKQSIQAAKLEISERTNKYKDEAVQQLREVEAKLSDVEEQLTSAKYDLEQATIKAPQDGIVVGSNVHTVGGVVAPGTVMMQIVPRGDKLIVEARLRPEDIEEVHAGSSATVRLTGFNRRTTPLIAGTLAYVSADALYDEATQTSYYLARIEVDLSAHPDSADIALQPGMPATVMITTGTRTVVDYVLSPVMDGVYKALREG